MKKMETKTVLTIDALSILSWAEDENGYIAKAKLPIKMMWGLKEDISRLDEIRQRYNEFDKEINDRYMSDEFSFDDVETDENGNENTVRRVKDEYLDQFNSEKRELLFTENEIEINVCDIEDFGDVEISIQDLNMLNFFIASEDTKAE